jgi:TPR repeat protein
MRSVLGLLLLALWQSLAVAAVPAADALWAKGDFRGAFAAAIEPAIRGDAHAQFLIGESYRLGRSVDPDIPQAEDWYARAARQGDVGAATELGLLLASHDMESAALPWLTFAAKHGEPRALCSLAALYFNGDGVRRDEALAYALMVRASRTGLPEAKARLATLRTLLSDDAQNRGEALLASAIPDVPVPTAATPMQFAPPAVPAAAAVSAPVRIQVGAFRTAAAAEKAWTLLREQVDGLSQTDHAVVQAGNVYRLQARLSDRQAADQFRQRLKDAGWKHFTRMGIVRA